MFITHNGYKFKRISTLLLYADSAHMWVRWLYTGYCVQYCMYVCIYTVNIQVTNDILGEAADIMLTM